MAKKIKINQDLIVKKSEVVVRARYKLNPLSLKFITTLIAGLKKDDDVNEEYVFRVKDFGELMGLKRKDLHSAIREAVKELLDKPLYIPEDNGFMMCNWISGGRYIENAGEVRFMIYPPLRPYLLEAQKKFLKYKLKNILSLKSGYAIRLYEILKDSLEMNSKYGRKAEIQIKLDKLKQMLEIPNSYVYGMLKKRVLEKAKTELEKHTDIIFDYNEIKTGRKVTELLFVIKTNIEKIKELDFEENIHFKSRRNFVALLRKNYAGNGKFFGYKTFDNKNYWLGINNKGLLYASGLDKELNGIESERIYDIWFNIAKMLPLYQEMLDSGVCLNELHTYNLDLYMELMQEIREVQREQLA